MNQDYSYIIDRLSKKTSLYNQVLNFIYNSYLENLQEGDNPVKLSFISSILTYYIDWSALNNRDLSNLAANNDFMLYLKNTLGLDINDSTKELFLDCAKTLFHHYEDKKVIFFDQNTDKYEVSSNIDSDLFNLDDEEEDSDDVFEDIEDLDVIAEKEGELDNIFEDEEECDFSEQEFDKKALLKKTGCQCECKKSEVDDFNSYLNHLNSYIQSFKK